MTTVNTAEGSIETDLPAEAVKDLEVTPEAPKPAEPAEPEEGKQPDANKTEEPKPEAEKPKVEEPKAEPAPVQPKPKKAGPIADLLEKKHQLEADLAAERQAKADLETKLAQLSQQPASPQATDKIKDLADKYGLEPEVLSDIVAIARDGMKPSIELPKEVQDLIAENNMRKATDAEHAAFNKRVDSLAAAIPGEAIKAHRDRIMELAYSDGTDPQTGERYADMELAEIYFRYIKPEVEPGKPSGEAKPTAGTRAAAPVLDFQDVLDRDDPKEVEDMDDETFTKYQTWLSAKGGDVPIRKNK